jgi:hypothetical protein
VSEVTVSVGAALAEFRRVNGLCDREREARLWWVRFGGWVWPLPNFGWRRRAIDAHDVHHLLTGYPCTAAGEVEIAAWELGAGRFPHWGATLACSPLIVAGVMAMPGRTLAAWRRGRRCRTLYDAQVLPGLLDMPLSSARARVG